jgi:hypothetical protein
MRRSAYREAIALSRRGLELLATLPDTEERARQELRLQVTLGVPLIATEGYAAPEVGSVYVRARGLCERFDTTPEVSQVLWGLWTFHTLKADLSAAQGIAGELLHRRSLDRAHIGDAAKIGFGTWLGILFGVVLKLGLAFTMLGLFALAWWW